MLAALWRDSWLFVRNEKEENNHLREEIQNQLNISYFVLYGVFGVNIVCLTCSDLQKIRNVIYKKFTEHF